MYPDHEFDPITPEEEAQRAQEAEFARRVRREVLRIEPVSYTHLTLPTT